MTKPSGAAAALGVTVDIDYRVNLNPYARKHLSRPVKGMLAEGPKAPRAAQP